MNVLCDFHHTDLFRSLRSLFEKRLGGRLYRPLGQDWWERGFYHHPEPIYGQGCLTKAAFHRGHLRDYDTEGPSHYPHGKDSLEWSWITLDEASHKIDLVVSTYPSNVKAFGRFVRECRPGARLIQYLGNEGEYPAAETRNALCANRKVYEEIKKRTHAVFFHPEIDLSLYRWTPPPAWDRPVVRTFLNFIYHNAPQSDKPLYRAFKARLAERAYFFTHGLGTPPPGEDLPPGTPLWSYLYGKYGQDFRMPDLTRSDGEPESHEEIARLMQQTNLAWHVKTADGYGYALHQLYASGRPVICQRANYAGKTGGLLLEDKKTCVMIDGNIDKDTEKIFYFLEPDRNRKMCEAARRIFEKRVSFEKEARAVKKFLEVLR